MAGIIKGFMLLLLVLPASLAGVHNLSVRSRADFPLARREEASDFQAGLGNQIQPAIKDAEFIDHKGQDMPQLAQLFRMKSDTKLGTWPDGAVLLSTFADTEKDQSRRDCKGPEHQRYVHAIDVFCEKADGFALMRGANKESLWMESLWPQQDGQINGTINLRIDLPVQNSPHYRVSKQSCTESFIALLKLCSDGDQYNMGGYLEDKCRMFERIYRAGAILELKSDWNPSPAPARRNEAPSTQGGTTVVDAKPISHGSDAEPDTTKLKDLVKCAFMEEIVYTNKKDCKGPKPDRFANAIAEFCPKVDTFVFSLNNQNRSVLMNHDWRDEDDSGTISLQIDMPASVTADLTISTQSCAEGFGALQKMCGHSSTEQYNRGGQLKGDGKWGSDILTYTLNANPRPDDKCHFAADVKSGEMVLKLGGSTAAIPALARRGEAADKQEGMTFDNKEQIDHKEKDRPDNISTKNDVVDLFRAITAMCDASEGYVFGTDKPKSLYKEYHLTDPNDNNDRSNITTQIDRVSTDGPPLELTKKSCIESFRVIVDKCNSGGKDGKQGGQMTGNKAWFNDNNLRYTLNNRGFVGQTQAQCPPQFPVFSGNDVIRMHIGGWWPGD